MDDSISRAAAIDALDGEITITGKTNAKAFVEYVNAVKGRIERIPPIQPKRGKWTYGEDEYGIDGYHCNQCGFFVPWDYAHTFINYIEDYNFCPNCGADMRGGEDAIH